MGDFRDSLQALPLVRTRAFADVSCLRPRPVGEGCGKGTELFPQDRHDRLC
jgi:hypothetical protein